MTVNRAHTTAALLGAGVALFVASGACEARNVSRQVRVAFASAINFADVPTLMAHRILTQQGYVVTPTFYAQPEVAAEAIVRGDADFVLGSTRVLWAAAVKGAPVVAILQDALDNNVLVAPVAMTSCLELAKGRIGLHSQGSSGTILLRAFLSQSCPEASPTFVFIPGSATRTAALLAGALDAAMLQRSDALAVEARTSRRLVILQDFGVRWPGMVMRATFVHIEFARAHPDVVQDYVEACLQSFRAVAVDPQRLASEASVFLATDEDLMPAAQEYVDSRAWNVDGGLAAEHVQRTAAFFRDAGVLPAHERAPVFADRAFLDRALATMGRRSPGGNDATTP